MKQKKIVGSRKSKKLLRISQYSVEPQQTKEALRRSEEQYRMLVEQASDGIFVADSHNYVIDVNTSGCLMLGYTRQELVGRHITELIAQKDILAMTEIIDQIRNGKTVVREIGFFRKNGVFFLAEISMKMFPDGRWQGIARDITERRRTEEALKESEVRYRGVVEDQVDLIRRFQPDGTLILVNGAFCRCFGKTTEELLGQNVLTLILPEDRELFRQQISSLTPDCPVAVVERRFIRPDGEVRWQQWVNRAIFGEGSQIVEFQSVGRDITVQKQVEQQLKESEARYRGVVEDQVELIRRFLPDGTLTFVNGAFCRYFDKTMEELLGQSIMTLIPEEDHEALEAQIFSLSIENPVAL
ncbi:MAG TPA: PAS domain S-box protein, partial [Negativicutes bacterium]